MSIITFSPRFNMVFAQTNQEQTAFDFNKYVYSGLNEKKITTLICLDICKAFDVLYIS